MNKELNLLMNSICRRLKDILVSPFTWGITSFLIWYWLGYTDAILDIIFTTIPETSLNVIAILILLKKRKLIDIYFLKESINNVMIPTIPTSIICDTLQYIFHVDQYLNFILTEFILCAFVIYLIIKNNVRKEEINIVKIITYVVLVDFTMIFLTEGFYTIIVTLVLNKTIIEINSNIWLTITLSLIPRILQILLLILYLYKNSFQEKISYIDIIFKNKVLSFSTMIFFMAILFSGIIFTGFLAVTNLLKQYELLMQILTIVLVLILPSILVSSYIISVCDLMNKNIRLQKEKEDLYGDDII